MYSVVKVKDKMATNSPCAACKFLRRKCTQECVFAPYFPPDQPQKFANVHKVYGASNVAKLLNDLPPTQREDAVNSLAYEADARLRDPVYGCVGLISILQHRLKQVQMDLENAKRELANYIGPSALVAGQGFVQQPVMPYYMQLEPERPVHQQQKQRSMADVLGFNAGAFDPVSASSAQVTTGSEFCNQTSSTVTAMSPCLSLGGSYDNGNDVYEIQHHQPHHHHLQQLQLFLQQQPLPPQRAE